MAVQHLSMSSNRSHCAGSCRCSWEGQFVRQVMVTFGVVDQLDLPTQSFRVWQPRTLSVWWPGSETTTKTLLCRAFVFYSYTLQNSGVITPPRRAFLDSKPALYSKKTLIQQYGVLHTQRAVLSQQWHNMVMSFFLSMRCGRFSCPMLTK